MINVDVARAAIAAAPGDRIVFTKAQADALLSELEIGQQARRQLSQRSPAA